METTHATSGPLLPDRIGPYDVVDVLGSGASSVVYRAHESALGIDVAVKVLAEPHAHDPELRNRFVTEARMLGGLSDNRIVTVHDIGEFEGRPYLAMEFIDGGSLQDRLADGRVLDPDEIEWLVTGLGAAIVVVHAAGFVHRGIRPGNVLIRRGAASPQVVLVDFGLAREIDPNLRTVAGTTDDHTAPEQRLPGATVDGRADVYAASGVVGRAAFGSEWRRILVPSGPHQVTALEPPGTEPLAFELRRGLSVDPPDRHASISEWTEAVRDATADHAVVIETEDGATHRGRPVVRFFAAGLVVLAMLLAFATVTTP